MEAGDSFPSSYSEANNSYTARQDALQQLFDHDGLAEEKLSMYGITKELIDTLTSEGLVDMYVWQSDFVGDEGIQRHVKYKLTADGFSLFGADYPESPP
jgi:hypothetical protein